MTGRKNVIDVSWMRREGVLYSVRTLSPGTERRYFCAGQMLDSAGAVRGTMCVETIVTHCFRSELDGGFHSRDPLVEEGPICCFFKHGAR